MVRYATRLFFVSAAILATVGQGCSSFTPAPTPHVDASATDTSGGGPPGTDAGPVLNNCNAGDFTDRSAGDRTVSFGGQNGSPPFNFAPRCITVNAGQSVTFSGTFASHPLSPGTDPTAMTAGSPNNPIQRTMDGAQVVFMFPAAGIYPFFCEMHYGGGMRGVVQVR